MDRSKTFSIHVSGCKFEIPKDMFTNFPPPDKVQETQCTGSKHKLEHHYFRNREIFEKLLQYKMGGKLHLPQSACPEEIRENLTFWNVQQTEVSPCCLMTLKSSERETKLIEDYLEYRKDTCKLEHKNLNDLQKIKRYIWDVMNFNADSILSKIYFITVLTFIMVSVFSIAVSTLPEFRTQHNTTKPLSPDRPCFWGTRMSLPIFNIDSNPLEALHLSANDTNSSLILPTISKVSILNTSFDITNLTVSPPPSDKSRRTQSLFSIPLLPPSEKNDVIEKTSSHVKALNLRSVPFDRRFSFGHESQKMSQHLKSGSSSHQNTFRMSDSYVSVQDLFLPMNTATPIPQLGKMSQIVSASYLHSTLSNVLPKQSILKSTTENRFTSFISPISTFQKPLDPFPSKPSFPSSLPNLFATSIVDNQLTQSLYISSPGTHSSSTSTLSQFSQPRPPQFDHHEPISSLSPLHSSHLPLYPIPSFSSLFPSQPNFPLQSNLPQDPEQSDLYPLPPEHYPLPPDLYPFPPDLYPLPPDLYPLPSDFHRLPPDPYPLPSDPFPSDLIPAPPIPPFPSDMFPDLGPPGSPPLPSNIDPSPSKRFPFGPESDWSILKSVSSFETTDSLLEVGNCGIKDKFSAPGTTDFGVFWYISFVTNIFFFIDLVFRAICSPRINLFLFDIINVADILITLCSPVRLVLHWYDHSDHVVFDSLLYVQMFRVIRIFRILRRVKAFNVLCFSLKLSLKEIVVLILYQGVAIIIVSNLIYMAEDTSKFPSIPQTWWFSFVSMTTLGYGDMIPETVIGKVVTSLATILGLVLFSLVIPIVASKFMTVYDVASMTTCNKDKRGYNVRTKTEHKTL